MSTAAEYSEADPAQAAEHPLRRLLVAHFCGSLVQFAWIQIVVFAVESAGGTAAGASALVIALVCAPVAVISLTAGLLADRLCKRSVIVATKLFEVVLMAAGTCALYARPAGSTGALVILALLGMRAAVISPAQRGLLPAMLPHKRFSAGNGLIELSGGLAMSAGTVAAGAVLWLTRAPSWLVGLALIALSLPGLVSAWRIPSIRPARADGWITAPIGVAWRAFRTDRILRLGVAGQTSFWTIASLIVVSVFAYSGRTFQLGAWQAGVPLAMGGLGIATGAGLAGRISASKVEYGLIPLGATGLTAVILTFAIAAPGLPLSLLLIVLSGLFIGLLVVPLNALVQWRAPADQRGVVIGLSNTMAFSGALAGSLALITLAGTGVSARSMLLLTALALAACSLWALWLVPDAFLRLVLLVLASTLYRVRVIGRENVPEHGGALLAPNHVSFADGLFLISAIDRPVRFVVYAGYFHHSLLGPFLRALGAIPISGSGGPKQILQAFREAGRALDEGHLVCIFPEGQITRTGTLQSFQRGMQRILKGRDVRVIPVHLDRATASLFSPTHAGPFPESTPLPVTVSFGPPLPSDTPLHVLRQRIHDLDQEAWAYRKADRRPLHHGFIRRARRHPFRLAFADLEHPRISGIGSLTRAITLARALRPLWEGLRNVGILLPASPTAAIANVAVSMAGRTAVNLNFTASQAELNSAVRQTGLTTVITSRVRAEKAGIVVPGGVQPIWLEEIAERAGTKSRLTAVLLAWLAPIRILERVAGSVHPSAIDDIATIIFTSGSTDEPKGVVLSHFNIDSNVEAITQVFRVRPSDRLLGVLPLCHAFGYTAFWLASNHGMGTIFHGDSSDAGGVGSLAERHRATILLATPRLLKLYQERCAPAQFGSIRLVIAGAQALPAGAAEAFEDHFGIRPLEGYGMTECSPCVAVSTPDYRAPGYFQPGSRRGCVGRVLPGVSVQVVDPATFHPLDPGSEGLILVKGPNVMQGYVASDRLSELVLRNGWFITADLGAVDEDGFLKITGRSPQFSKSEESLVVHDRADSYSKTQ